MAYIDALMITQMITADPDEAVSDVAGRMATNQIGAVLVVKDGSLCGVFSERDLLVRVVAEGRDPKTTRLGQVATTDLVTIEPHTHVRAVLEIFREKKLRHVPVVENGKPVGILSTRDFLDYLIGGLESYIDDLRYKRELAEGVDPYDHIGGSYGR
jgi:CBS domain-containing protein